MGDDVMTLDDGIINVICDAALVFGYAEERRQMDLALITEVFGELESTGVWGRFKRVMLGASQPAVEEH